MGEGFFGIGELYKIDDAMCIIYRRQTIYKYVNIWKGIIVYSGWQNCY